VLGMGTPGIGGTGGGGGGGGRGYVAEPAIIRQTGAW
jgi:hypothetical protein